MPQRILVTGSTGTIGSAVVRALLMTQPEEEIFAATRNPSKLNFAAPVRSTLLDFDTPATIPPAMEGVNTLFLVTGYTVSMLHHSKLVLDAARAKGVRHVVHLGAWGSDQSRFQHLVWHDFVEHYIQSAGFSWTHLRPKTFMRNLLTALRPGSTTLRQFYGQTVIGWIDPDDVASVAAACLLRPEDHAGKIYPLAEEARSVAGVAQVLSEETGLPFRYEARDPHELAGILAKAGMEPTYGQSLAQSTIAIADGEVAGIDEVFGTVRQVTGRPGATWRDFARRHREFIIKRATAASK